MEQYNLDDLLVDMWEGSISMSSEDKEKLMLDICTHQEEDRCPACGKICKKINKVWIPHVSPPIGTDLDTIKLRSLMAVICRMIEEHFRS